jgi:lipopolysaccharide transport system ATP-binding protein
MSGAVAIRAERLGKKYVIGAEVERARYRSLRDSLGQAAAKSWRRAAGAMRGQALLDHGTTEEFWALRDVDFEVRRGEVLGIIGRNGAGKSTLLKVLSRITEPTCGRVTLKGRVASLLEVGTGFHPELTGRENIFLNGAILGMTRGEIRRKFEEIVDFAEVERFIDTPVKRYSSGMYVRLAFAVAAHLEPEILVVDEVLAVGDIEFQRKCVGKMSELSAGHGRTVLFVSHNLASVESLCDRALLLDKGRVVLVGDAASVIAAYARQCAEPASGDKVGYGRYTRFFVARGADGEPRNNFAIGDDIIFDIDLHSTTRVARPRYGIGICNQRGERLLTLHTDIQQNAPWDFIGEKHVRVVWKNVALNAGSYWIETAFWDHAEELETLRNFRALQIVPSDVYGTGVLPDLRSQGCFVPDASWQL